MLTPGADVVPLDDLRIHDVPGGYVDDPEPGMPWKWIERPGVNTFADCWCNPRIEPIALPDGTLSELYVHRSMDRREESE